MDDNQTLIQRGAERDIEEYAKQNGVDLTKGDFEQSQVDFCRLYTTLTWLKNQPKFPEAKLFQLATIGEIENFNLFITLLSTKPTFAKVAHENLKRLNK